MKSLECLGPWLQEAANQNLRLTRGKQINVHSHINESVAHHLQSQRKSPDFYLIFSVQRNFQAPIVSNPSSHLQAQDDSDREYQEQA